MVQFNLVFVCLAARVGGGRWKKIQRMVLGIKKEIIFGYFSIFHLSHITQLAMLEYCLGYALMEVVYAN